MLTYQPPVKKSQIPKSIKDIPKNLKIHKNLVLKAHNLKTIKDVHNSPKILKLISRIEIKMINNNKIVWIYKATNHGILCLVL